MSAVYISLDQLKVSPHNVRKSHDKSSLEELKASILSHGLLQPPLVTKAEDGSYDVVDGGRRLTALQGLQKDGKLPKDHKISCELAGDANASELSLAANIVRDAMHPADEFEAFAALADAGMKPAAIAKRFGVTEKRVQQRMKLARLAPEVFQAYREDKMSLDCAQAFTITDDHELQRKIFKAEGRYMNTHHIRSLITQEKPGTESKLGKFVGIAAYQKAGGTVTADLFGKEKFFDDGALLQQLAQDKLAAEAEKLKADGWAWAETALERDWQYTGKMGRIEPKPINAPKKLAEKYAKLSAEYEAIDEKWMDIDDEDPAYEDTCTKRDELQEQVNEADEEIKKYVIFDPEEKKHAGAYIAIDHGGDFAVTLGLVRKQDAAHISGVDGDELEDDAGKGAKPKEKGFSQSIIDSLKQHRLQIVQAVLASDPEVTFDLLAFKAAIDKFTSSHIHTGPDVSFSRNHFRTDMVADAKNTAAGKMLLHCHEQLALDWLKEKTESAKFEEFRELTQAQKLAILAYCVAGTLQSQLAQKNALESALGATEAQVTEFWRPTAENYLGRITKDQLLDIGKTIFSKAWAEKWASAKKGDIVKELDRAFADPKKFSGNKETEQKLRTWLPDGMAFTAPEKKPAKAKKKAA
ncbi:MAG TPA: ParB/RepB/Spo0J family partition protein [Bryobacteraceae bacterium]|jgi:ParB family chromosome partitioning protein|nr:ParB/RepB/Spo0J family partition protein [Bryobacteraceae bacterium]